MITQLLPLLFSALLLVGCASITSAPENNVDFLQACQLADLAGVYSNKGEPEGYFSRDVLKIAKINHERVTSVRLSVADNLLTAQLIEDGCVNYEKTYVIGQDIQTKDGKLLLHEESHLLSSGAPDDPVVGPRYTQVTFGLDARRDGKLRTSGYIAGLAFLVFPVGSSEQGDIRFKRMDTLDQECSR
jgi:hypothetical protein